MSSNDFGKIGAARLGAQDPVHHAGVRGSGGGAPQPGSLPPSLANKIKQSQTAQRIYAAAPKSSAASLATTHTFIDTPRRYVLLNSSPEAIWCESQGCFVIVPPRGEIIPEGDPRFHNYSLYDEASGDYVPGSVVAHDLFTTGDFGEQVLLYDVVQAVKQFLGPDLVSGPYAKRGLSVMPLDATQEMIDALNREGHSRWEIHRIENAKAAVRAEQDKADRYRKLGLPIPPASPDVEEQALFLQEVALRQRARIADILNAEPPAVESDATKVAGLRAGVLDDLAQPKLQTPLGTPATVTGTTREALLAALRNDPDLRRQIVETAVEMEKRSAAAQAVINQAGEAGQVVASAADRGPTPIDDPPEPSPEEPAPQDPDDESPETTTSGSGGPGVVRHRGHPRR